MRLRVDHQHSQFWPILTCFVDYYSLFSGPEVISIVVEPRGALTCRSSTLTIFADSGTFRGLLLTVWGPKAISMVVEPQGALTCRSSTIAVWADFGLFLALLLSFGGPGMISMIDELRCAFTCRSSRLTSLADSGPFHALLLTVLASQSNFQDCKSPGCVYVSVVNTHSFGQF